MVVAFCVIGVRSAGAQASQCASVAVPVQDACNVAIDLFHYMTPQLGIALTGGNMILGQGGTNGGLRHSSVGARVNLVAGSIPELQAPSETGATARSSLNPYPTKDQYLGLPFVDASIGLYKGFPLGFTSVGGVDVLLSAAYVPTVDISTSTGGISIEPDTPFKIGYGVRVGLLEETVLVPGVSISFMLRDLPTTTLIATTGNDSLGVTDLSLKTTSWRVTTGKSFVGFTIAGGLGQDTYDASTTIESVINRPVIGRVTTGPLSVVQKVTRTNFFGSISLNLLIAKLVAEGGVISGGGFTTFNTFDINADASRIHGAVGLRIGF